MAAPGIKRVWRTQSGYCGHGLVAFALLWVRAFVFLCMVPRMAFRTLDDLFASPGLRALVRVDFNLPMEKGEIADFTRLDAALPTIRDLAAKGARVILLAHFDRPEGRPVPEMSLAPIAPALAARLGAPVAFAPDCIGPMAAAAVEHVPPGGVLLLENVRFHSREEANAPDFIAALARLGDVYVNDAFSAAHRAHASTEGLARALPAFAGRAMQQELVHLNAALGHPQRPVLAIVGGAKVSTKLDVLRNLVGKVDMLAIGGGMANTFLFAQGFSVGKSLCERDQIAIVQDILAAAAQKGCKILLPQDVVAAAAFAPNAPHRICAPDQIGAEDMVLDAGPASVAALALAMDGAKTLIWNGPLGAFETPPFDAATMEAARAAAMRCKAGRLICVGGGGDTVSALHQANVAQDFTFLSTAGGAFLEWMGGKTLPGIAALEIASA